MCNKIRAEIRIKVFFFFSLDGRGRAWGFRFVVCALIGFVIVHIFTDLEVGKSSAAFFFLWLPKQHCSTERRYIM